MIIATERGYYGLVKTFLSYGFNPNLPEPVEVFALEKAVTCNKLDICSLLLENGANPDLNSDGVTPLINAVEMGNLEMVKLLVEYGADLEKREETIRNCDKYTPCPYIPFPNEDTVSF